MQINKINFQKINNINKFKYNKITTENIIKDKISISNKDLTIKPLIDEGEIFNYVLDIINKAKDKIFIGIYLWGKKEILDALKRKAKEGVKIYMIVDPYGYEDKDGGDKIIKKLKKTGINIVKYPTSKLPHSKIGAIAKEIKGDDKFDGGGIFRAKYHLKTVSVDGKYYYLGSGNFEETEWWLCHDTGIGGENKDIAKFIEKQLYKDYKLAKYNKNAKVNTNLSTKNIQITTKNNKQLIINSIQSANKSIDIEAFVLSSNDIVNELIKAAKRGVKIRLIINIDSHTKLFSIINSSIAKRLSQAGIKIKLFKADNKYKYYHSKLAIIDNKKYLIGTGNWSVPGFDYNREMLALVEDKNTAKVFGNMFNEIFNKAQYKYLQPIPPSSLDYIGKIALTLSEKYHLY